MYGDWLRSRVLARLPRLGRLVCDVDICRNRGVLSSRAFGSTALAPLVGIRGRNRSLEDRWPVERDVRILRFERAADTFVERLAPDPHIRRRPKPVQHTRPHFAAPVCRWLHEIEILVAAFVAAEAKECHAP